MESAGVSAYWEANAETWTRLTRAGYDIYRDYLNTPAFLSMLPPVKGLRGLDIGCGEGANTRKLAGLGAHMQGIDIAPTFLRHAEASEVANPLGISYLLADAAALPFPDACFDFVTAFMSLMDLADLEQTLTEARRVLRPGGFLQFSILHPCFAPLHRAVLREPCGKVRAIEVARYFEGGQGEVESWCFSSLSAEEQARCTPFQIPRFHHTLSEWVNLLCAAGLMIEEMGEPSADEALAQEKPALADTRVAPLFLHIRVVKPAH
jgi:SAM-dependent methyltransferase